MTQFDGCLRIVKCYKLDQFVLTLRITEVHSKLYERKKLLYKDNMHSSA